VRNCGPTPRPEWGLWSGAFLAYIWPMLNRRRFLNDLTRHEAYLCSHLREISKRCRISSVLISGISAGRRTWMDASDAELEKAASYVEKNDAGVNPRFKWPVAVSQLLACSLLLVRSPARKILQRGARIIGQRITQNNFQSHNKLAVIFHAIWGEISREAK